MRIFLVWIFFGVAIAGRFPALDVLRPVTTPQQQQDAVYALIDRLLPGYSKQFQLTVDPTLTSDNDMVVIDRGANETIKIVAGHGVALAWGVNKFLRSCCKIQITWDGKQVKVPEKLSHPPVRSVFSSIGRFRYYANVCTHSYSFVWWGWTEWEQHLDWMALNGINLPLASVAQEAIWLRVYDKLGMNRSDIDEYFTGPAFHAWRRMGNLKRWGGPLSNFWHEEQLALQHRILSRMSELGMIPVLSAFAGHVPDAITKIFPNANVTSLKWNSFNCSYTCVSFIDPLDPLFQKIGSAFLQEQKVEFGLFHAYSADPFNEMSPKSYESSYLRDVGQSIYKSMATVDPDAIWVMQAWMFVGDGRWQVNDSARSFLTSVPSGRLLMLDLYSEQIPVYHLFESFYGQPFIWNVLHNFGGMSGMYGAVSKINTFLWNASTFENTTLVGTGLTMEGIFQNYAIYQFSLDRFWSPRRQALDQNNWIKRYAWDRYGSYDENLERAWKMLWISVYDDSEVPQHVSSMIMESKGESILHSAMTKRPNLSMKTQVSYPAKLLCESWRLFVESSNRYSDQYLFKLDLVDVTREVLQMLAGYNYRMLVMAYGNKSQTDVGAHGGKLVQLYEDLERILATHQHFLLGRWIRQARAKASDDQERDQYEYNLRNQLTLWGPNGEILDYARKDWAGLMSDYYKPRWLLFVASLLESLLDNVPFSQAKFNLQSFLTIEQPFTNRRSSYPDQPVGDAVMTAQMLYETYYDECQTASQNSVVSKKYPIGLF